MKISKTANGKQSIKLSQLEWEGIGLKAGWHPDGEEFNKFVASCLKDEHLMKMAFGSEGMFKTAQSLLSGIYTEDGLPYESGWEGPGEISWENIKNLPEGLSGAIKEDFSEGMSLSKVKMLEWMQNKAPVVIKALLIGMGKYFLGLPIPLQISLSVLISIMIAKYGQDFIEYVKPFFSMMQKIASITGKSILSIIKTITNFFKSAPDFVEKVKNFLTGGGSEEELRSIVAQLEGKEETVEETIEEAVEENVEEDKLLEPALASVFGGKTLKC